MGHSRAEKAQSRERIVSAAATRIREAGLDGISVGELMKSVNLTHGGFYGHFESRADLIETALERALADGDKASALHTGARGSMTVKSIVNSYLSPAHRDHPSSGCAIATLAGEVGRASPDARAVMAEQLNQSFEAMAEASAIDSNADQFAVASWSTMIGAIMISRIFAGDPKADQILEMARKSILEMQALYKSRA